MKHEIMNVRNPFNAPVFHVRETVSTMAEARLLFAQGEADGTTIYADYQSSGRGRIDGREWSSSPGESLLCTTFLRGQPVRGLTLRVGLALALTFDAFLSPPSRTQIKWPNDVLFQGKKLGGILCENDGSAVYIGTGLNIAQTSFPEELALKASSLALIASGGTSIPVPLPSIEQVLERYLQNLLRMFFLRIRVPLRARFHRSCSRIWSVSM